MNLVPVDRARNIRSAVDDHIIVKGSIKNPIGLGGDKRDENPDKWSPQYEYDYRIRESDKKVDKAVARAWSNRCIKVFAFSDIITQERWNLIFDKK